MSRRALGWLCLLGFGTSACALVGYDFGDYQRAPSSAGAAATTKQEPTSNGDATEGGARNDDTDRRGSAGQLEAPTAAGSAGAAAHPVGAEPTTFSVGGAPNDSTSSGGAPTDAGAGSATDAGATNGCVPQTCEELGVECGVSPLDDGCGRALDCGGCFWFFLECRQNVCEFTE